MYNLDEFLPFDGVRPVHENWCCALNRTVRWELQTRGKYDFTSVPDSRFPQWNHEIYLSLIDSADTVI